MCRVLTESLLLILGRCQCPHIFHLFAAIGLLHVGVVKGVFALRVFGGPKNRFGRVREIAAGQIGRGVGFLPRDLIEQLHAKLLHGVAHGENDVVRAANPNGAVGLEKLLAATEPFSVEIMVFLGAA